LFHNISLSSSSLSLLPSQAKPAVIPELFIYAMPTIFLTGASGYIGGQVPHDLATSHPEFAIRALVRNEHSGKAITAAFSNVQVVQGDLGDAAAITKEVENAHVILHLAATGHLKSVQTIHETLKSRPSDKPAYWIQVSGASALAAAELADASRIPGSPSDVVFDDLDGASEIVSVIKKHPSRAVDNYILSVADNTPQVNTALVFPGIVYGQGQGPVNQRSIQIPELAKATLQRGRGLQVGKGLSRWGNVHIQDVGKLFVGLVDRALPSSQLWNLNGLYLSGVGEMSFGDISSRVAAAASMKGFIPNAGDVDEVIGEEADKLLPHGRVLYGTNARTNARRAKELLGWKPQFGSSALEEEILRAVEQEAKSLGLYGANERV
ncbi:Nad dependent epimerase dehydratase family protein, partial [Tolypocladium paradoxum]